MNRDINGSGVKECPQKQEVYVRIVGYDMLLSIKGGGVHIGIGKF